MAAPTITDHESEQIERANASGLTPVVFVHGLWLLPSSWDRWATAFEEAGYTALTPGWPDDPETVAEANANPDVFAGKTIGDVPRRPPAAALGAEGGQSRTRQPAQPQPRGAALLRAVPLLVRQRGR